MSRTSSAADRDREVGYEGAVAAGADRDEHQDQIDEGGDEPPSVNWVPRSRMKLRSIRGPNCVGRASGPRS